ncbi:hypothetical protein BX666DRAFT_1933731 [Dichotomocladium elegans]|nr:hypothetical protein BX666DRAFT_1933731 [Dichotomocladium elegans]
MLPVILSDDEVEAIFTVAPPKLLIVHAKILHRFKTTEGGFKSFLGLPTLVIGVGGPQSVYRHLSEYYTFHSPSDLPAVHPDTSAFFVCTSGSTGPRKLIDITNRIGAFRMHDMFLYLEHSAITPNSIVLSSSSFSFVFSMMVYVQLYVQYGVRQYVLPSDDLDAILEAIHQHRVTLTSLISPKHVATIAERPGVTKNYDLACLKTVRSGGQMLAEATVLAASRILGVDIENPFGTSEVSVVFQSDKSGCRFLSFDGKIRLHDDRFVVKLIDDEGQPVPKGQLGELCVKSPAVARGYFNNPIKTAEAFDDDGFYHTGDIFFLNDDGNYVIQGRKSDIIKTAKKYCSPVPIVDICMSFGGISQCAVVGAYDAKVASEFPRAYIVPHNLDAFPPSRLEEFIQYVNERVPDKAMMLTGGANILPMLPYTASNKLDMFKLRGLAQKELEEMTGP